MPKFADNNDFLQTIVYFLIVIVGLVASAYRNFNKQKETQKKQSSPEEDQDFPDVSIGPVFEYKPEVPVDDDIPEESYMDHEIIVEKAEEPVVDLKTEEAEGEPDFESTRQILLDDQILTSENIFENDLTKQDNKEEPEEEEAFEFDVRKAVIYSEILNPKYS